MPGSDGPPGPATPGNLSPFANYFTVTSQTTDLNDPVLVDEEGDSSGEITYLAGVYTVPLAGYYLIDLTINTFAGPGSGPVFQFEGVMNGVSPVPQLSLRATHTVAGDNSGTVVMTASAIVFFNAGDTFQVTNTSPTSPSVVVERMYITFVRIFT